MTFWNIFFLVFPENRLWHFMQMVDNLHKMSMPVLLGEILRGQFANGRQFA